MNRVRRRVAVVLAAVTAFAASASPAAAAPNPTPNGFCGALNMLMAGEAMFTAMALHTNANGDAGMFHAVAVSCRPSA